MLIGVPKEIKTHEYRVSLTPAGVREIVHQGHQVIVETEAGSALGFDDAQYVHSGALVVDTPEEVFDRAEMIIKVKEPQRNEFHLLKEGQILFSYLHLAAEKEVATALIDSGCIAIAYETVCSPSGGLPLLAPMSEVAGRVATQAGAHCLERPQGGKGVLLPGTPGVPKGKVTIIGGGVVGSNAAQVAIGMGASVTILDRSIDRIRELELQFGNRPHIIYSTMDSIEESVINADLVIGAVLIPGAEAPKIVTHDMIKKMEQGSVFVDVAIDQGGCSETSKPTTHVDPTYTVDGVVHYCVTNIPSAVAKTATIALENTTLPYILKLANQGYRTALSNDLCFQQGLNVYYGKVTHEAVANNIGRPYVPLSTFFEKSK